MKPIFSQVGEIRILITSLILNLSLSTLRAEASDTDAMYEFDTPWNIGDAKWRITNISVTRNATWEDPAGKNEIDEALNMKQAENVVTIYNSSTAFFVDQTATPIVLHPGETVEISTAAPSIWNGGKIWIDWNRDGIFADCSFENWTNSEVTDKGELVGFFKNWSKNSSWSGDADWLKIKYSPSVFLSIPSNIALGDYRMRLRTTDSGSVRVPNTVVPTSSNICGQAQDFIIRIAHPEKTQQPVIDQTETTLDTRVNDYLVDQFTASSNNAEESETLMDSVVNVSKEDAFHAYAFGDTLVTRPSDETTEDGRVIVNATLKEDTEPLKINKLTLNDAGDIELRINKTLRPTATDLALELYGADTLDTLTADSIIDGATIVNLGKETALTTPQSTNNFFKVKVELNNSDIPVTSYQDVNALKNNLNQELTETFGNAGGLGNADQTVEDKEFQHKLSQWQFIALDEVYKDNLDAKRKEDTAAIAEAEATAKLSADIAQVDPTMQTKYIAERDARRLKVLRAASACANTIEEFVEDPEKAFVLETIMADREWLADIMYSGECHNPIRALEIIAELAGNDAQVLKPGVVRNIATATALEYARHGWTHFDGVERATFFIKSWKEKRLHTSFDTHSMHLLRVVCGWKGNDSNGTLASLQWCQDTAHVPLREYPGFDGAAAVCWRAPYRYSIANIWGDSIHGNYYYTPYDAYYNGNRARATVELGGICGAISHYGATTAIASGLPAVTMGEPGHCAHAFLIEERWRPTYSLSWQHSLHWQVWSNIYVLTSLNLSKHLYSHEQEPATNKSSNLITLAKLALANGKYAEANALAEKATAAQPRNYLAWIARKEIFQQTNLETTNVPYNTIVAQLCESLAVPYPEMTAVILDKSVHPILEHAKATAEQRRDAIETYWKNAQTIGVERWDVEGLLNKQRTLLANGIGGSDASAQALTQVFEAAFKHVKSKKDYMSIVIGWASSKAAEVGQATEDAILRIMLEQLDDDTLDGSVKKQILAAPIREASSAMDITSFNNLSNLLDDEDRYSNYSPSFTAFPGKLVSEGGLVATSSTSQWDTPWQYAGMLTTKGGAFHTNKDNDAWVLVKLTHFCSISGVVLTQKTSNNMHRQRNMKIQVSETGLEGSWVDVHNFGPTSSNVMRADLSGNAKRALYIRIMRVGGPEFFHLNGIYIYGTPES